MYKIFKRYGCEPTPISKPSMLRRRERNVTARAAIDIGKITECSEVKKNLKVKKKCEKGNTKCNMENVPKGHIIHSDEINIWNVNSKCLATKRNIKIHTMKNPYHCSLCAQKSISRSHMKSHARENLNP